MKANLAVILAILACAGLGVVLWQQNASHAVQKQELDKTINSYSNKVSDLEGKLSDERSVRTTLETNLAATQLRDSNELATISATLSAKEASLVAANMEAKKQADAVALAAAKIDERDKKIAELEAQKSDLDKESNTLHSAITNLDAQIKATQEKLKTTEGKNELLTAELEHLRAQKAELERKLSDLASLQEQVRTLKDNLSIARRLDFLRQGLYSAFSQKASEHMINPLPLVQPPTPPGAKSLDVELHERGPVKINSPSSTNPPATNAPPASAPPNR